MYTVVYDYQTFSMQQHGGISRYFCELAYRVHRAPGFQAHVVAPVHFNDYLPNCDVPQTAIHLPKVWKSGPLFRTANRILSPALIRRAAPPLIHRTFFDPIGHPAGTPVVITVHDMINELFPERFPPSDPTARNKRLSVEGADHILCNSHCTARDLMRVLGVSRSKITVTHLGYSPVFSTPPDPGESPPRRRPYLLYVGHRAGHKNFDLVLQAFAASKPLRDEFDLVAFGGLPFSASERSRMAALGIAQEQVIRWTGSDLELARAYRHARAFLYPSLYEGFGIPLLEAMASGCVVACSNTSSLPEVADSAALQFDPRNVDAARSTIETACFDDFTRARLTAAGQARVLSFSWDRCAAETIAAYRKIIGTP
jgi:glycosyltransferase involved in cell wall biosynthesis